MINLNPSEPDPVLTWVRGELQRFGEVIATEIDTLRTDLDAERTSRAQLEAQIATIAEAVESGGGSSAAEPEFIGRLEAWITEFEQSSNERHGELAASVAASLDEVDAKIAAQPTPAAQPAGSGASSSEIKDLELRQEQVESAMESTRASLVQFDEQAARMVSYFSESVDSMREEIGDVAAGQSSDVDGRLAGLEAKADEAIAAAGRAGDDAAASVRNQVDSAEDRVNSRMMSLEMRIQDDIGVRVADIDAHVGRIGAGLDDSVLMLNDRIAAIDAKFGDVEADLASAREMMASVDEEAIDEMKEKISSALGQAELVRIEMERFQETIDASLEKTAVRLTEIETTVQDQAMDVETAVQLERLEEVERAVLMLDPDIINSRNDDETDAAVAVSRPGASEPAAPANETAPDAATPDAPTPSAPTPSAPTPNQSMDDRMAPPPASAPLSPPTVDPTVQTEPAAPSAADRSMSFEPPVNF